MRTLIGISLALALGGTALAQDTPTLTLGNGEKNWISLEGLERSADTTFIEQRITSADSASRRGDGATLTFSEVHIEGDGWLVLHPFMDGKPNGVWVAGYSFVESGTNKDVSVTLNPAPKPGTMLLVMLHSDTNKDGVFDFVFVEDGVNVEDRAVFEGSRMVAHIFPAP